MLGMYQWALTNGPLLSDAEQTPDSHAVWTRLGKMHKVQTVERDGKNLVPCSGPWDEPSVLMLIER